MSIKIRDINELNTSTERGIKTYYCSICRKWYHESEVSSLKFRYSIIDKQGHRLHQMY